MKKMHKFIVTVLGFLASYIIDIAYLPVYICISATGCYVYAMVSDIMGRPYVMPLWKLLLAALGFIFLVVSTILNVLSMRSVRKRMKEAEKRMKEAEEKE